MTQRRRDDEGVQKRRSDRVRGGGDVTKYVVWCPDDADQDDAIEIEADAGYAAAEAFARVWYYGDRGFTPEAFDRITVCVTWPRAEAGLVNRYIVEAEPVVGFRAKMAADK